MEAHMYTSCHFLQCYWTDDPTVIVVQAVVYRGKELLLLWKSPLSFSCQCHARHSHVGISERCHRRLAAEIQPQMLT